MPIVEAMKQLDENSLPEINLRTDIILFRFSSKERANPTAKQKAQGITEGNSFFKGTFVGEDEKGSLTCQKVVNVFFSSNKDMVHFLGDGEEIEGVSSSCLVFLQGNLGSNDIELDDKLQNNKSFSLSAASVCKYSSKGEFTYKEETDKGLKSLTIKGTPGSVVLISSANSGVMKLAPKLSEENRPTRKAIKVSTKVNKKVDLEEEDFTPIETIKTGEAILGTESVVKV